MRSEKCVLKNAFRVLKNALIISRLDVAKQKNYTLRGFLKPRFFETALRGFLKPRFAFNSYLIRINSGPKILRRCFLHFTETLISAITTVKENEILFRLVAGMDKDSVVESEVKPNNCTTRICPLRLVP